MKVILKIIYNFICKIIIKLLPLLRILRLQTLVIDQLSKIRLGSNKYGNIQKVISELPLKRKLIALDVGAQGGFNMEHVFLKKYENFFNPIMVEPIPSEAEKLKKKYTVIEKGLWSTNCIKKLYVTSKAAGTSVYKPWKEGFDLYNPYDNYFRLYDITDEIDVECTTIKDSLDNLNIKELDYLKIDTQGAEYEILKGIGNYFPLLMKIEVQLFSLYKGMPHWTEMLNYIYKLDYMLCSWEKIGLHITQSPIEMDMFFIPNFLTEKGKDLIHSRENEFAFLMLIFGQVRLLQTISKKLEFKLNSSISKIRDKFFD